MTAAQWTATRATIIGRGYSAGQIDAWDAENGAGDRDRALSAFPNLGRTDVEYVHPSLDMGLFGNMSASDAELIFTGTGSGGAGGGGDVTVNAETGAPALASVVAAEPNSLLGQIIIAVIAAVVVTWLMKGD